MQVIEARRLAAACALPGNLPAIEGPCSNGKVVVLEQTRIRVRLLPIGGEDD